MILTRHGQRPGLEPPLIGAHDDSPLHSIGADDNAAGVTALLELARKRRQAGQNLRLMVSLEMLGCTSDQQDCPLPAMRRLYGDVGAFIAVVGNASAAFTLSKLARSMGRHVKPRCCPDGERALPDVRLSNQSHF